MMNRTHFVIEKGVPPPEFRPRKERARTPTVWLFAWSDVRPGQCVKITDATPTVFGRVRKNILHWKWQNPGQVWKTQVVSPTEIHVWRLS